jgi:hypothetical protein
VARLNTAQRQAIGALTVTVAHVDGKQTAAEMRVLAKIYRLLELPEESLYRDAHVAATEPITVALSGETRGGFAIPKPPLARGSVDTLDARRLKQLQEESARVSAMLGEIFASTEIVPVPAEAEPNPTTGPTLAGLDTEHSEFSSLLLGRSAWSRGELEDLAADRGIMLDGALERVNEAFMDAYGEPLLDGSDPVTINRNVAKQLEA